MSPARRFIPISMILVLFIAFPAQASLAPAVDVPAQSASPISPGAEAAGLTASRIEGQVLTIPCQGELCDESLTHVEICEGSILSYDPALCSPVLGRGGDVNLPPTPWYTVCWTTPEGQKLCEVAVTSAGGEPSGSMYLTGRESGALLEFASGLDLALGQNTLVVVELTGGSESPIFHLRLDEGIVATLPGGAMQTGTSLEIDVPGHEPAQGRVKVRLPWLPSEGNQLVDTAAGSEIAPAVMVGHHSSSGDVVVSVLDGTASLMDGERTLNLTAGEQFTHSSGAHDDQGEVLPMADEHKVVWTSALRFGHSEPDPFPILIAAHTDSSPVPFHMFSLVHSSENAVDGLSTLHIESPNHSSHPGELATHEASDTGHEAAPHDSVASESGDGSGTETRQATDHGETPEAHQ